MLSEVGSKLAGKQGGVGDPRAPIGINNNNPSPQSTQQNKKVSDLVAELKGSRVAEVNECVCWHCRMFEGRVRAVLGKILREGGL